MNLNVLVSNSLSSEMPACRPASCKNPDANWGTVVGITMTFVSFQFIFDIRCAAPKQVMHSGSKKKRKMLPPSSEYGLPSTVMLSGALSPEFRFALMPYETPANTAIAPAMTSAPRSPCGFGANTPAITASRNITLSATKNAGPTVRLTSGKQLQSLPTRILYFQPMYPMNAINSRPMIQLPQRRKRGTTISAAPSISLTPTRIVNGSLMSDGTWNCPMACDHSYSETSFHTPETQNRMANRTAATPPVTALTRSAVPDANPRGSARFSSIYLSIVEKGRSQKSLVRRRCAGLLQPLVDPSQERAIPQNRVLRLQNPVAFVGEEQQFRRHVLHLKRREELQPLRIRDAKILLAVNHQRRRVEIGRAH